MESPFFSIIIPIYNTERYIKQCLTSILEQSFSDFEVFLIDDGSTDNSINICQSINDTRTKIIRKNNEGVSIARNIGLNQAKGKWIIFIDSDDFLVHNHVLKNLYTIISEQKAGWYLFNSTQYDKGIYKSIKSNYDNSFLDTHYIQHIRHFALWGYVFKNSIIQQYNIRFIDKLAYSEDRIFIYHYAIHSSNIYLVPEIIYAYRINDGSVCQSKNGLRKAKHQFWAASILNEMAHSPLFQICQKQLNKECKKTINFGFYSFIETQMGIQRISQLYKLYKSYLPKGRLEFTFYFIKNTLLYCKRSCGYHIRKIQS